MPLELIFATNNKHKLEEISKLLFNKVNILSLNDIGCFEEIPEDKDTLEGNALQKARFIYDKYQKNCIADDTGLEVEALSGRPGVHSARYSLKEVPVADEKKRSEANVSKLLSEMANVENRNARFRTVICYIENGKELFFEGVITGKIINERKGHHGFGYDPVFVPENYNQTFAELGLEEKNKISHRALAIASFINHINKKIVNG